MYNCVYMTSRTIRSLDQRVLLTNGIKAYVLSDNGSYYNQLGAVSAVKCTNQTHPF